jgi:hypothetical protein
MKSGVLIPRDNLHFVFKKQNKQTGAIQAHGITFLMPQYCMFQMFTASLVHGCG